MIDLSNWHEKCRSLVSGLRVGGVRQRESSPRVPVWFCFLAMLGYFVAIVTFLAMGMFLARASLGQFAATYDVRVLSIGELGQRLSPLWTCYLDVAHNSWPGLAISLCFDIIYCLFVYRSSSRLLHRPVWTISVIATVCAAIFVVVHVWSAFSARIDIVAWDPQVMCEVGYSVVAASSVFSYIGFLHDPDDSHIRLVRFTLIWPSVFVVVIGLFTGYMGERSRILGPDGVLPWHLLLVYFGFVLYVVLQRLRKVDEDSAPHVSGIHLLAVVAMAVICIIANDWALVMCSMAWVLFAGFEAWDLVRKLGWSTHANGPKESQRYGQLKTRRLNTVNKRRYELHESTVVSQETPVGDGKNKVADGDSIPKGFDKEVLANRWHGSEFGHYVHAANVASMILIILCCVLLPALSYAFPKAQALFPGIRDGQDISAAEVIGAMNAAPKIDDTERIEALVLDVGLDMDPRTLEAKALSDVVERASAPTYDVGIVCVVLALGGSIASVIVANRIVFRTDKWYVIVFIKLLSAFGAVFLMVAPILFPYTFFRAPAFNLATYAAVCASFKHNGFSLLLAPLASVVISSLSKAISAVSDPGRGRKGESSSDATDININPMHWAERFFQRLINPLTYSQGNELAVMCSALLMGSTAAMAIGVVSGSDLYIITSLYALLFLTLLSLIGPIAVTE